MNDANPFGATGRDSVVSQEDFARLSARPSFNPEVLGANDAYGELLQETEVNPEISAGLHTSS